MGDSTPSMNFKNLFFVALVASIALAPFSAAFSSAAHGSQKDLNRGFNTLAARGVKKATAALSPKIASAARILAGTEKRSSPVSTRVFDATADATCQAVKTCGACVTTTGCVWALSLALLGPMDNPTGFGATGVCIVGDATNGPADRTGAPGFLEPMPINVFAESGDAPAAYWSSDLACDKPYRVATIDAQGDGGSMGFAMRSSLEVDSTFSKIYSAQQLQTIGESEDPNAIAEFIAGLFGGIRLYLLSVFAVGGEADTRAGFGMFYFGTDLGAFMKAILAYVEKMTADPSTTEEFNPFAVGGAKSVMFYVLFDAVHTYAYTAGTALSGTTTKMASLPITSLTVAAPIESMQGKVAVYNYHLSGNLGTSQTNFDMSCYMGTDTYMLHGNSIDPTSYECDIIITNTVSGAGANGAAYGVGLNAIIIGLDVNMLTANAETARAANDLSINVGNADFVVLGKASDNANFTNPMMNVMVVDDPKCEFTSWPAAQFDEFEGAITTEFGGAASPFCVMYSFDASSPNNIYWDPKGDVNEEKANAAVNAKLASSSSAIAPFIFAIIAALAFVLAM
eukprot:Amastigsp_a339220_11933.p2 type:complete len:568 gc:universal Amastigsp_a339220_11933:1719-16(-)